MSQGVFALPKRLARTRQTPLILIKNDLRMTHSNKKQVQIIEVRCPQTVVDPSMDRQDTVQQDHRIIQRTWYELNQLEHDGFYVSGHIYRSSCVQHRIGSLQIRRFCLYVRRRSDHTVVVGYQFRAQRNMSTGGSASRSDAMRSGRMRRWREHRHQQRTDYERQHGHQ